MKYITVFLHYILYYVELYNKICYSKKILIIFYVLLLVMSYLTAMKGY